MDSAQSFVTAYINWPSVLREKQGTGPKPH